MPLTSRVKGVFGTPLWWALAGIAIVMLVGGFAWLNAPRPRVRTIDLHGMVAEAGGWSPASFTVGVGDLVQIRLRSGDVLHGFAIGQTDFPAVDVYPGRTIEMTVRFDRPGKYVYYCTKWCGLSHWRMRGTIEVVPTGPDQKPAASAPPLYMRLGLDLDAPHPAAVTPTERPAAARGASLGVQVPAEDLTRDYYLAHSPAQLWQTLRALPADKGLSDSQVWDLVASVWQTNTTAKALTTGRQLYAANCASCHGARGAGDGPSASVLDRGASVEFGSHTLTPTNFTDPRLMLGASPALLQGKLLRGGMGTGMPYWGPIFTDPQMQALVDYLYTFQMEEQPKP